MARITLRTFSFAFAAIAVTACGPTSGGPGDDDNGGDGDGILNCDPGTVESCYGRPSGTENNGPCHGGTRTCNDDGMSWTACLGEVVPVTELCANNVDEDCNGMVDDVFDQDADGYNACNGDCCELASQCGQPARVNPAAIE